MHPGGLEPQTYALVRAAAEIGYYFIVNSKYFAAEPKISRRSLRN
jgi:hypothetical protein